MFVGSIVITATVIGLGALFLNLNMEKDNEKSENMP